MARYRSSSSDSIGFVGGACLFQLIFLAIIWFPIALWTDRNLDFYVSLAKGTPVDVPFWISAVASFFEPIFLLDLIGELVRQIL
jgi:hypothetical protein